MERKRNLDHLQREVQELFSELWQVPRFSGMRPGFRPHVDCYRTDESLILLAELPGVDPDDVDVVVAEGTLHLSGKRDRPHVDGQVYQQMELDYGPFRRQIQLGAEVDVTRAEATYERGMLKIVLPLAQRRPEGERFVITVTRT